MIDHLSKLQNKIHSDIEMEKSEFITSSYEQATTEYTYIWELEKYSTSILISRELRRTASISMFVQHLVETDQITFDTGILSKTKHFMKAILIPDENKIFVNVQMGNPMLYDQFTHSKISLKHIELRKQSCTDFTDRNFTDASEDCIKKYYLKSELVDNSMIEKVYDGGVLREPCDYRSSTIQITLTFEHAYWSGHNISTTKVVEAPLSSMVVSATLDTKSLYENKQFSDFAIFCGDSNFKAHKLVLAARSPVFATMFEQSFSETSTSRITISDAEPNSIEQFLKYIYTGTANFETCNCAAELFILANKYDVDNLKQLCEHHLINSVNVENGLDLYKLGKLVNSEKLSEKCRETLKTNIKTIDEAIAFARNFPFIPYIELFSIKKFIPDIY